MHPERSSRKKTTGEIICENFKIPPETIFQDYKCTYRSSVVLFFGRLYVGEEHFLFIANMFGLVKKCCIKIDSITKIQDSDQSTVVKITEKIDGQQIQYIFGSFKNSNAFQLMKALWKGQTIRSDIFKNQNEQETEQLSKMNMNMTADSKILIQEGHVQANFFNPQVVDSQKQKIVEIQLPCSVEQFYDFFLADSATVYPRRKHLESKGGRDVKVTQWRKSQELNSEVRQLNAMIKVTGIPFLKEAGLSQVWMIRKQQNVIKLNIVTQMADVPYAAYFNCEQHIVVSKEGQKKCRMNVQLAIIFNKSTYMKGTILSRTFGDLKQQYQVWIKNVNNILDQLRKKKDNMNQSSINSDVQYQPGQQHSERLIPLPPESKASKKDWKGKIFGFNFKEMKMQQKVDLTLKLVLILLVVNILQIFF